MTAYRSLLNIASQGITFPDISVIIVLNAGLDIGCVNNAAEVIRIHCDEVLND